jgi:LmbE family N-acetylglucosaminyl deacetylase
MLTDAHPDDEDNALLAMLGEGQGVRTTLVTLTRGDGGQNEIGPEIGQSLGVLRTEELLAVHRFDGAEQYFTRAIDFGYSFSIDESIQKWGHDEIVGDIVRHIRTIRPDVIAGFLCGGTSGGLHHQASAALTLEAFRAAADPAKYTEQITEGLHPWQASRVFCTDERSFGAPPPAAPDLLRPDVTGFDPVLGRTYPEIGLEARSMHKCQGTSQLLLLPGQGQGRTFRLQDSVKDQRGVAPKSLFEGIDVTIPGLARLAGPSPQPGLTSGLRKIADAVSQARQRAALNGPAGAVSSLVAGRSALLDLLANIAIPPDLVPPSSRLDSMGPEGNFELSSRLENKLDEFTSALLLASGTRLDALADDGVVTPGQNVSLSAFAASAAPDGVTVDKVTFAGFDQADSSGCHASLAPGKAMSCKVSATIPANTHFSTPYWTPRKDAARYDFEPDVPFGVPFRPTPFVAKFELTIGGQQITVERPVQYRYSNLVAGEKRTELNVSPAFNVNVDPDIAVFRTAFVPAEAGPHKNKSIKVTVGNNQKGPANATVTLQTPAGWTVEPASQPIAFTREDEEVTTTFTVQPPASAKPGDSIVKAVVTGSSGARSDQGYQVVEYPHIHRRQVIQPADVSVKVMDVTVAPNLKVGYVMGVGDKVPEAIEQLGANVRMIDADTLASGDLSQFNVIVLGVRAYERRQDLRANNQRLLQYAQQGGTVIVQYQRNEFNDAQYGPYPAKTTGDRVTDENAPIEVLVPDHPIFTTPNRIGPDVWKGWVQERGTYFMGERDPRYVDLLRSADPFPYNAGPKTGILVEARVGKGRWLYTGLGLWRQLPAGTDGAYRLLANLISLGS